MTFLKPMDKHRAIFFLPDVLSHLNDELRAYAHDVAVEGRMMEFAEGEAIGDLRDTSHLPIRNDVRGLKKLPVLQSADRTGAAVGFEDVVPEFVLMQASADLLRGIFPPGSNEAIGDAI